MDFHSIFFTLLSITLCSLAAHAPMKPVHERPHENIANYGNPLSGVSQRELRQRAQIHVQNQQNRFNAEKFRQQKAMAERAQLHGGETMDSYVKAFQEQHDGFQREMEKKQSKGLNTIHSVNNYESQNNGSRSLKDFPNAQWWNSKQARSKRVHNERDLIAAIRDISNYGRLAQSGSETVAYAVNPYYTNSNNYNYGFVPMTTQSYKPKYYSTPIEYNKYNTEVDSLTALIGKEPKDQLRGFNKLLKYDGLNHKVTTQDLSNTNVNLNPSNLDEHVQEIKKYDFAPAVTAYGATGYGYSYQDSNQFLPAATTKDHIPITEHVQEVPSTNKPIGVATSVTYYQPTQAPTTHASNYYKVEVANHIVKDHSDSEYKYINEHNSGYDNLHYAAQYEFGYRVKDSHTGNDFGHQEYSDGESAKGSYHVLLPDGRLQKVNYVAGPSGYHADVSYHK